MFAAYIESSVTWLDKMSSNRVKVACRVRPALDMHTGESLGEAAALEVVSSANGGEERKSLRFEDGLTFTIDHVYDQKSDQKQIFDELAKPLVDEAFRGFNCTLFSYGQTGSGKTYTLQGKPGDARGIVPRTMEEIFRQVAILESKKGTEEEVIVEMHLSVMEIYQERLNDLLSSQNSGFGGTWGQAGGSLAGSANLRIREHTGGSVWVEGLTEVLVTNDEQFTELMGRALKKRATGSHAMNLESSRSHLVCIMNLRQSRPHAGQRIFSKIHLIDLAGSEMVRKTDASGQRMAEAKHINKSLSALGNVINALTAPGQQNGSDTGEHRRNIHVPFRDSKLTRLLQDSLGGNAKTVLVLAISESKIHSTESVNTLRFGERARQLCTKPTMNTDIVMDERKLRAALARAEAQILALTETIDVMQGFSEGKERLVEDGVTPRKDPPPGFSGTLGVAGGLSPVATPLRALEPQIVVEKEIVYVEREREEPEEVFCSQCAVILAEVEERVPASKLLKPRTSGLSPREPSSSAPTKATTAKSRSSSERASGDSVNSSKNPGSGGSSTSRAAPNLHLASFKKITTALASGVVTSGAGGGGSAGGSRRREREKSIGKSSEKGASRNKTGDSESTIQLGGQAEELELDLLGLWQKQQQEEQQKVAQPKEKDKEKPKSKARSELDSPRSSRGRAQEPLLEDERKFGSGQDLAPPTESVWGEMKVGALLPATDGIDMAGGDFPKESDANLEGDTVADTNPSLYAEASAPTTGPRNTHREPLVTPLQHFKESVAEAKPHEPLQVKTEDNSLASCGQKGNYEANFDTDPDEEAQEEIEDDGRCAVCGLDEDQTFALCADTGESMGSLFMCDGNCGDSYHARCVGLVDAEGVCLQPQGEWFCSNCTLTAQNEASDLLDERVTSEQREGTPSVASAIKAEYHAMRRERNRVLIQWQQEKRVAALVDDRNKQMNMKREEEHCAAVERHKSTEKELEGERAETERLRTLCDELMTSLEETRGLSGRGEAIAGVADLLPGAGRERKSRLKRPVFDTDVTCNVETGADKEVEALSKPEDDPQVDEDSIAQHVAAVEHALKKHDESVSSITGDVSLPKSPRSTNAMPASLRGHIMPAPSDSPLRTFIKSGGEDSFVDNYLRRSEFSASLDESEDLEESYESVSGSMSAGSSKLRGRLRDLLRTVKEEAGSYAEIRARREQKLAERRVKREKGEAL